MQPDDTRHTSPAIPARDDTRTRAHIPERSQAASQEAVANIARSQISSIMQSHDPIGDNGVLPEPVVSTPQTAPAQPAAATTSPPTASTGNTDQNQAPYQVSPNPYFHTHSTNESTTNSGNAQWQKYHSAWQRYYQEYYSRYYVGELYKTQAELAAHHEQAVRDMQASANAAAAKLRTTDYSVSQSEAMDDLRSRLRNQIRTRSKKVRASRHFVPISAAVVVMLIFAFLQFNSFIFAAVAAYSSPGQIDPANVLANPSVNVAVSDDPTLIIPKLNIDVPVDYNTTPDYNSQMAAMAKGTSYFGVPGADSTPGQVGNFAIAGHSSNQWYDTGKYKFIFVNLNLLTKGDLIYVDYQGTRYTYTVTHTETVAPTDVSALTDPTTKPELTLITCMPAGTALHRLLIFAEQISPDPSTARPAPTSTGSSSGATMPG
ncbi:MAG TPA: sortase, partial [Candidatus Saccharimonadaceae bacterium]|nr:sortase [Candidatus Saccharimonadaceae bacterium]